MSRHFRFVPISFTFGIGTALTLASAVPSLDPLWNPYSSVTAMGHTHGPSSLTITSQSTSFEITATVTDMDTFQRAVQPWDTQLQSGEENDVIIETEFPRPSIVNYQFNAVNGERRQTYTFLGPFRLQDEGQIAYETYLTRGKNTKTGLRFDNATNWGSTLVTKQYVPNPGGGGEG